MYLYKETVFVNTLYRKKYRIFILTPEQARAARAFLKIGVREVGEKVGVMPNTVSRIESPDPKAKRGPQRTTITALKHWYETQGIEFLEGDESGGPGIRFNQLGNSDR